MANEIYREIFVTREEYAPPIQYVQGANAIPIVVRVCDYNIPSGSKANVFVKKPSGKSVQDTAVIDGNTVTIDVTTQMFAEVGTSIIQIQITNGQDVLITFDLPAMVRKNRTEPGAPESENEAAFFTELQEAANKARIAAQEANNAAQAAEDALSVLEGAVEGTIINDDTPSDVTTFSGRHIENTFLEKNGDGGNVIVTFQQAADRAGIESGDSLAVAFGKLAKFFTDIQSYVFSPPVNNLLSTDTSRPLSAAMGKQLQEAVESINSALLKINAVDGKDGSSFNRDFQSIGLNDPDSELSKTAFFLINASEQDQWSHIPTGLITTSVSVGIREVFRYSSTVIMVKVTEIHPKPGTQYYRTYNSGEWNEGGWKVISPD